MDALSLVQIQAAGDRPQKVDEVNEMGVSEN